MRLSIKPRLLPLLALTGLFLFSLNSCHVEPTHYVCFGTDFSDYEVGEIVTFNNCSDPANDYLWDFGDGTQSYGANVTHTYNYPGEYTITLTGYFGSQTKYTRGVVQIYENTELRVITYYYGTSVPVAGVDVILYQTYQDWQQDTHRYALGVTDQNGEVRFVSDRNNGFNLNSQPYYVYASIEDAQGKGYYSNEETNFETTPLSLSDLNIFEVDLLYYPNKKKKR
jgi:hypothetical protein